MKGFTWYIQTFSSLRRVKVIANLSFIKSHLCISRAFVYTHRRSTAYSSWFMVPKKCPPPPHPPYLFNIKAAIKEGCFQRRASSHAFPSDVQTFFFLFLSFSSFVTKFLYSKESCFLKPRLRHSWWTLSPRWTSQELSIACVSWGSLFFFSFFCSPRASNYIAYISMQLKSGTQPSAVKTGGLPVTEREGTSHQRKLILK